MSFGLILILESVPTVMADVLFFRLVLPASVAVSVDIVSRANHHLASKKKGCKAKA